MKPTRILGDWGSSCLLILDWGFGSGPSATETNNTASGQGQNSGNRSINNASGSIAVAQNSKYLESGSQDLSNAKNSQNQGLAGAKISVAKGATLTITEQAAAPIFGSATNATQPIASLATTSQTSAPVTNSGPQNSAPVPTDTSSSTPSPSTTTGNWWDQIPGADQGVAWWGGLSVWQQVAAAAAGILVIIFIFHRRKSA